MSVSDTLCGEYRAGAGREGTYSITTQSRM
jgi:hypothetical protein